MVKISLKVHGGATHAFDVHPEFEVLSLKALVEEDIGIAMDEQRILHKGRAIQDEDTLEAAGVHEGAQLYVVRQSGATADVDPSAMVPQPGQQPSTPNDMMASMLNSPVMQGMLDNPEVLRSMLLANPQMREVMENNPELAHVLNDPATLRQSLASARNPQLMREMMRNTDRAMSNIEALPGGHNALRRMYETVQAPLEEGLTPAATLGGAGGSAFLGQQQQQQSQQQVPGNGPNTSALPNPWARPPQQQQPQFGQFGRPGQFGFGGPGGPPFGFGGPP